MGIINLKTKQKIMEAIKNLEQTIEKIEWEILQCYDDSKLYYLQRAKKEAIICMTTLKYINQ